MTSAPSRQPRKAALTGRLRYIAPTAKDPDRRRQGERQVAESLFCKATGDGPQSVAAAIFWLKTRAGWKETTVHEHGSAEGMPLVIVRQIVDPRNDDAAPLIDARPVDGPVDALSDDD